MIQETELRRDKVLFLESDHELAVCQTHLKLIASSSASVRYLVNIVPDLCIGVSGSTGLVIGRSGSNGQMLKETALTVRYRKFTIRNEVHTLLLHLRSEQAKNPSVALSLDETDELECFRARSDCPTVSAVSTTFSDASTIGIGPLYSDGSVPTQSFTTSMIRPKLKAPAPSEISECPTIPIVSDQPALAPVSCASSTKGPVSTVGSDFISTVPMKDSLHVVSERRDQIPLADQQGPMFRAQRLFHGKSEDDFLREVEIEETDAIEAILKGGKPSSDSELINISDTVVFTPQHSKSSVMASLRDLDSLPAAPIEPPTVGLPPCFSDTLMSEDSPQAATLEQPSGQFELQGSIVIAPKRPGPFGCSQPGTKWSPASAETLATPQSIKSRQSPTPSSMEFDPLCSMHQPPPRFVSGQSSGYVSSPDDNHRVRSAPKQPSRRLSADYICDENATEADQGLTLFHRELMEECIEPISPEKRAIPLDITRTRPTQKRSQSFLTLGRHSDDRHPITDNSEVSEAVRRTRERLQRGRRKVGFAISPDVAAVLELYHPHLKQRADELRAELEAEFSH